MAERRMIAKSIIDSDAFLEMPSSTQALYFHLAMRANNKGELNNAKSICRCIGCEEKELRSLFKKGFITIYEDETVYIVDWDIHTGIGENARERLSFKYRTWRSKVLERDGYKCFECGVSEKIMHAHHIKHFATHINLRYDLDNGITLCPSCHKEVHQKERDKTNGRS